MVAQSRLLMWMPLILLQAELPLAMPGRSHTAPGQAVRDAHLQTAAATADSRSRAPVTAASSFSG